MLAFGRIGVLSSDPSNGRATAPVPLWCVFSMAPPSSSHRHNVTGVCFERNASIVFFIDVTFVFDSLFEIQTDPNFPSLMN